MVRTSDERPTLNREATAKYMKIVLAAVLATAFLLELFYQYATGQ
jgi:hypothetical protein